MDANGRTSPFRVLDLPVSSLHPPIRATTTDQEASTPRAASKGAKNLGHPISDGDRGGLEDDKTADLHPAPFQPGVLTSSLVAASGTGELLS
jgi:hypothetical protein